MAALARAESRLLVRHPGYLVGLALTGLGVWALTAEGSATVLGEDVNGFLSLLLPAWGSLIAVNLAALRSRRDGTDELFDSLPTAPVARTAAHLLSSVAVLVPTSIAFLTVWFLWTGASTGAVGTPSWSLGAAMVLIVAGAGVSGVLVARWVPIALGGPLAVIATIVLQNNFWYQDDRWRWLHFVEADAFDPTFDIGHPGWHVVWVAGLVLLGVFLALARHGVSGRIAVAGGTALALLAVSGWVQTRPLSSARVAARIDELQNPAAHQVCEEHGGVRYCAYPSRRAWIPLWRQPVEAVLARVPTAAAATADRPLEVRQRAVPDTFDQLVPPLQAGLDPKVAWVADGAVHPGMRWQFADHPLNVGYQTASWAVGLPPAVASSRTACSAGGQARVVTAMWLAGKSGPRSGARLARRAAEVEREGRRALVGLHPLDVIDDYVKGELHPGSPYVPEVGSAGRGADVVMAARLLALPADRVAKVVATNWALLTDPATTAATLFELLGTSTPTGLGELPPVTPGVGRACP
ncbi:MAG TPA: hypothetical protein VM142_12435 [Acidimicrobiales bacterium]|nr:hypothetical protein [Acidimicrobiales bacterium]